MKISIIGHGFVGKAVEYGFTKEQNELHIIDPNYNTSVKDLNGKSIDVNFVCVPTPFGDEGKINASIVEEVIDYLVYHGTGIIVLKSTVTPDLVKKFSEMSDRFVYNPEFLTERNANHDFVHPPMHVFGGQKWICEQLKTIYLQNSNCNECPVFIMKPEEASFVKYGINSFLATKVAWFNQYYDMINSFDCDYSKVIEAISCDQRIGSSHTQVPGPDGKRWFGGACFGKDTSAILTLAINEMHNLSILKTAMKENAIGRSQYELDDREKAQNVNFDLTL